MRSKEGASGVTPSMLSGWELGKHITSIKYRKVLADYYAQPRKCCSLTRTSSSPRHPRHRGCWSGTMTYARP